MYGNRSGGRPGQKNAQQNTEAVSGNRREAGSVLFPALFSGESADPGYYSGDGGRDDSYCEQEIVKKYGFSKVRKVTAGGKERYDSVYAGLLCCQDTDYVYIHDGARPFITEEMVQRGYEAVKRTNACVMGMPSKDTVKLADSSGYIKETPDRKIVWNIQTPQIFSYDLIRGAYESIRKKDMTGVTDDAMVVEQETGTKILLVEGSYQNIKITTPEDLAIAEAFLRY